jgi:lysine-specific demethylase 8
VTQVARVSDLSPAEFVARYEQPELPVVLASGAAKLRATERWSPEYLKQKWGSLGLEYKLSASHQHPNFHAGSLGEMFARERGTLGSLIDAVTSGPADERARRLFTGDERFLLQRRAGQTRVDPELAPLLDDVVAPAFVPPERLYTIWAWFSGRGVRTWLHYDNNGCHNLNAQLRGSKSCTLYPPESLPQLAPFPLGGPNPAHNCSSIDVEQSELPSAFQQADAHEARLEAGDLLFIPAYWFHTFRHEGDFNANVNFWWKPERPRHSPVAARQAFLDAVARAKLDTKPNAPGAELLRALDAELVGAS